MSGIIESCLLWPPMLTKNRDDPDGTLNLVVRLILPVAHTIKFKKKNRKSDRLACPHVCVCVALESSAGSDHFGFTQELQAETLLPVFHSPHPKPKAPPAASVFSSASHLFQQPTVQIYLPPVSFPSQISATLPNITSLEIQFGAFTDSS